MGMTPEQAYSQAFTQALAVSKAYTKKTIMGQGAIKGDPGFSPTVVENPDNTNADYRLDITTATGGYTTPNLMGPQGLKGEAGAQGIPGPQGRDGVQGQQGIQGIQGPKGDDGYPFLIYKEYAALSDFNAADFPEIGLMFMVKEKELGAFPVYRFTGDEEEPYSYVTGLSDGEGIKGDKGDPGEQGAQGIPGKDGRDGTPGADGKDATINGVNTLTIEAGDNVSIKQDGDTLVISSTGESGNVQSSPVLVDTVDTIFKLTTTPQIGGLSSNLTNLLREINGKRAKYEDYDEIHLCWYVDESNNANGYSWILRESAILLDVVNTINNKTKYMFRCGDTNDYNIAKISFQINKTNDYFIIEENSYYGENPPGKCTHFVLYGIKYVKADGSSTESNKISQDPGNAIVEKEDGIFVQDNSEDIERLQEDVKNTSNRVDTIKKYQRYLNTGLDYAYLQTSLTAPLTLKRGMVVPFDTVVESNGIEIDLENYGVMLKAGKTYELLCEIFCGGMSGAAYFHFFDLTNQKELSSFYKTSANANVTGNDKCGILIITPNTDIVVQVLVSDLSNLQILAMNKLNNFTIKEINRSIVIDPVEHVNAESGIEDTPVGDIISYMGTTAPKHYLACDGAEYNVADYPYLAQHFIDDFGSVNYFGGDGETTFAVPDLRGEFLRGAGEAARATGAGEAVGEHQEPTIIPYFRTGTASMVSRKSTMPSNLDKEYKSDSGSVSSGSNYQDQNTISYYSARPTNTSILWCIKYEPTYFVKMTGHIYSYEERWVGTWIDGKPLYEKTVDFGNLPNAAIKEVPHGIEDVDLIWLYDGLAKTENGTCVPLNFPSPGNMVQTYCDKNKIAITTQYNRSEYSAIVILRYTKTI